MDRKAFYNLEYGVFMLSSRSGEKLGGCIINTCASVDHDCRVGFYVHTNEKINKLEI